MNMKSRRCFRQTVVVLLGVLLFSSTGHSVSLHPTVVENLRREGRLQDYVESMQTVNETRFARTGEHTRRLRQYLFNQAKSRAMSMSVAPMAPDTLRVLVILVDFDDMQATSGSVFATQGMFDSLLFSTGRHNPTGSMTEFYIENSYNQAVLIGEVVGWYRMPQLYSYYVDGQRGFGTYPRSAEKLAEDAFAAADADVDFSLYDIDGDNWVDGPFIIHAGQGYEDTGNDNFIHSHVSGTMPFDLDGVTLSVYSMEPEEQGSGGLVGIGVFCHEYGHVLDLPDLYDGDYSSAGLGDWSLMAGGSWTGNARVPVHYDAWCKSMLGWVQAENVIDDPTVITCPAAEWNPSAYRVWRNGNIGPEYFLVENRRKQGFDQYLPGEGLLIFHIDETVYGNWDEEHPLVALEQADGRKDLENNNGDGDIYDPFYAPFKTDFDDRSIPASRDYDGLSTETAIFNVSTRDSVMTADVELSFQRPYIVFDTLTVSDSAYGDGNGRPDPGERIQLFLTMSNVWADATDLQLQMDMDVPGFTVLDGSVDVGPVAGASSVTNTAEPFEFMIDASVEPTIVDVEFSWDADNGVSTGAISRRVHIGQPEFLIVDDDGDTTVFTGYGSYHSWYVGTFEDKNTPYLFHDIASQGVPSLERLQEAPNVIWFTGDPRPNLLPTDHVDRLREYLDTGGRLVLTGQSTATYLAASSDSSFLHDYCHVRPDGEAQIAAVSGVAGDPITNEFSLALVTADGAANQQSADFLTTDQFSTPIFHYLQFPTRVAAARVDTHYRLVFLGFGFEAISNDFTTFGKREEFLDRILAWWNGEVSSPGDLTGDGIVNLLDVVALVNYLFHGIVPTQPDQADTNGDCATNLVDVVYLIDYLYRGGPDPVTVDCK